MRHLLVISFFLMLLFKAPKSIAQQLYIKPNTQLVLNGNVALVTNNAAINNNGTILPGTSTVYVTGYSDTAISNITGISKTTLTNFAVNKQGNNVAIKSKVDITNTLVMIAGNLYPDSNLTLKSTAVNTARVTPVPASCQIIGKAMVERYIPARRSWRLLTSPLRNTNSIYNTWQNRGTYTPGAGMYITGPNPTGAAGNGLDSSIMNNKSLLTWNASTQLLETVTNTHVSLSAGTGSSAANTGYFAFVRGDRTYSNFTIPNRNITTLISSGVLQTGTQIFSSCSTCNNAGQYFLIGNPFASPIDFNSIGRTNLVNRFYVWDPSINTLGAYVMLDDLDGDGIYTKTINASSQSRDIQSGQAFFIQTANAGSSALSIAESNKSGNNNTIIFRPSSPLHLPQSLRIALNVKDANGDLTLADEALAEFSENFSNDVTIDDAIKFGNIEEGISFVRNGKTLTAERKSIITCSDTLFIKLSKTKIKSYQLVFSPKDLYSPSLIAVLEDRFLNNNIQLPLNEGSFVFNFNVTSDTASTSATRFRIVFKLSPVNFISLTSYNANEALVIEWAVTDEINIASYTIEKSADSINFNSVGCINSEVGIGYRMHKWIDETPNCMNYFYRIKSIDNCGNVNYSKLIKVTIDEKERNIYVYPNPVKNNTIQVIFFNQPIGKYSFILMNEEGQTVFKADKNVTSNYTTQSLQLQKTIPKGIYQLKIRGINKIKGVNNILIR